MEGPAFTSPFNHESVRLEFNFCHTFLPVHRPSFLSTYLSLSLFCPQFLCCSVYFFLCFSRSFHFVPFYFLVAFELRLQVFFVSLHLVYKTCAVQSCTVPVWKATCVTLLLMLTAVYPCVTIASST